ncbi:MAG: hypothetical protein WAU53_15290 [Rhodoplanes sp.]
MDALDPSTWKALKDGISFLREAIGLTRDAKNLLADGSQKAVIDEALTEAGRSAAIAESTIASSLGYPLCRCTFPPQIMLLVGRNSRPDKPIYRCSACGNQEPSAEKIMQWAEAHRSIEDHNLRAKERYERRFGRR